MLDRIWNSLCVTNRLLARLIGFSRFQVWGGDRIRNGATNSRMLGREVALTAANQQVAAENYSRFCLMFWLLGPGEAHLLISAQGMTSRSAVLTAECCSLSLDTIKNPGWTQFRWMARDPAATATLLVTECFVEEVAALNDPMSPSAPSPIGNGEMSGNGNGTTPIGGIDPSQPKDTPQEVPPGTEPGGGVPLPIAPLPGSPGGDF